MRSKFALYGLTDLRNFSASFLILGWKDLDYHITHIIRSTILLHNLVCKTIKRGMSKNITKEVTKNHAHTFFLVIGFLVMIKNTEDTHFIELLPYGSYF